MPQFTGQGLSDTERLTTFIRDVQELLRGVVERGTDSHGHALVPEDLRHDLRDAWKELEGEFDTLVSAIPRSSSRIREHGLFGAQLRFKLGVVGRLWDRFVERGGLRLYWWLLHGIDGVLDSLIDATGVGAAIRELKEAMMGAGEALEE